MPRSFRGFGAINRDSIDPAPALVPFTEYSNWPDKFGDMGKLAGLLEGSIVRGNDGDWPDFAFLLPLAHQVGKDNDTVVAECGD